MPSGSNKDKHAPTKEIVKDFRSVLGGAGHYLSHHCTLGYTARHLSHRLMVEFSKQKQV